MEIFNLLAPFIILGIALLLIVRKNRKIAMKEALETKAVMMQKESEEAEIEMLARGVFYIPPEESGRYMREWGNC